MRSGTWVIIAGCALILVGAVWAFQGVGMVGGSFMTGERRWLYIGVATAVAGLAMLAVGARLKKR